MQIVGAWLLLLFVVSGSAHAQSDCQPELSFAHDGSIRNWTICYSGKSLQAIESNQKLLTLNTSFNGDNRDFDAIWEHPSASTDGFRFVGRHDLDTRQISRTYRQSSESTLTHSLRMTGLSRDSQPVVSLVVDPGVLETSSSIWTRTFADLIYSFVRTYMLDGNQVWRDAVVGDRGDSFAVVSRHKVLIVHAAEGLEIKAEMVVDDASGVGARPDAFLILLSPDADSTGDELLFSYSIQALAMQAPDMANAGHEALMYADLWSPLAVLTKWVETFLIGASSITGEMGLAIIILAIAIRLVTYPISLWAAQKHGEYVATAEKIEPLMREIRKNYKGAEQSERILAVYRDNNISPFSGLKGSIGLFVQIPFLLAVYNVTTISSIFKYESFLWITDLSIADEALGLPFFIPLLGNTINLLPLMLGAVNIFFADATAGSSTVARSTPILISLLIMLLFYSISAAAVLYWLTVNILQVAERRLHRRFKLLDK